MSHDIKDEHVPFLVVFLISLLGIGALVYSLTPNNYEPQMNSRVTVECVFGGSRVALEEYKNASVETTETLHAITEGHSRHLFPVQNCLVEVVK